MNTSERNNFRGSITVFLSMILILFLSLVCTAIESARIQGARAWAVNAADIGVFSTFGGYKTELLKTYEVFGLEESQGEKLEEYIKANCSSKEGLLTFWSMDPWKLELKSVEITSYALLSDQSGKAFYQQAAAYMRENLGTEVIGRLVSYYNDAKDAEEKQKRYVEQENEVSRQQGLLEEKQKQQEAGRLENPPAQVWEPPAVNPLDIIKRIQKLGLLGLVVSDSDRISKKEVDSSSLLSKRDRREGDMELPGEESLVTDLFFREYLLKYFSHYQKITQKEKLNYQIEYLIGGKASDTDNLKKTVNELVLLREGVNYLYLYTDASSCGQAQALAAALVGGFMIPGLITVTKHALLLAWAFAESLLDVHTLLDGGKIPLLKSKESWKLELSQLGNILEYLNGSASGEPEGLDYEDYLRILLYLGDTSSQSLRALDLLELNLSDKDGEKFQADRCMVGLTMQTEWEIEPVFLQPAAVFMGVGMEPYALSVPGGFAY